MSKNFSKIFITLFLLIFFGVPPKICAENLWLQTSIGGRSEYDDNVVFAPTEEDEDFIFIISPAAKLSFESDLVDIQSDIIIDAWQYLDRTDLNTVNQLYELNGIYRFRPRWSFSGLISYIKDTTLDSQLQETGRVSEREDRRRFDADAGIIYQLSELSELGFNYHFKDVNFESDFFVDYDRDSATLSYNRKMKNQVNTLGSQFAYYYRNSDVSDLTEYNFQMSMDHLFSPQTRFYLSAGLSYSEQEFKDDRSTDKNLRPSGHSYIRWKGETSAFTFGYRRDIRTDTNGEAIDVDRIYCRLRKSLTERWELGFAGKFYYSRDIGQSFNDGIRFLDLEPKISYKLTENHDLQMSYSYSNEKDNERESNQTADRNRIWLGLYFNFPKQWKF
jgi:hypothetical protein